MLADLDSDGTGAVEFLDFINMRKKGFKDHRVDVDK